MIIQETNIPNVTPDNIDTSKQVLAENIIQNVYPLFNEVYQSKVEGIKEIQNELKIKTQKVIEQKNELKSLMNEYARIKKVSKLINRIEKLINSGLIYDGALKHETTVLLKIVNKLENEKLDYHLRQTLSTINKRFAR